LNISSFNHNYHLLPILTQQDLLSKIISLAIFFLSLREVMSQTELNLDMELDYGRCLSSPREKELYRRGKRREKVGKVDDKTE
jgi:hypothetical protein